MTRRLRSIVFCLAVGALAFACSRVAQAPAPTTVEHAPYKNSTVVVRNEGGDAVRVYLSENGNQPFRLGIIEAGRREFLNVRFAPGATYTFVIIPMTASQGYITEGVMADPGDTLKLNVANHLNFTTLYRSSR